MILHSLTTSSGIHKRRVIPRNKVRLRVRYLLFSVEDVLGKGMREWVTYSYVRIKRLGYIFCVN